MLWDGRTIGLGGSARRSLAVAATLLLVISLAACGGAETETGTVPASEDAGGGQPGSLSNPALGPRIISESQIEAEDPDSAARGLLEWWSAFQYGDEEVVVELTSPEALDKVGEARVNDTVDAVNANLQGFKIQDVREEQDEAVIRALMLTYQVDEDGELVKGSVSGTTQSFRLVRDDGVWLFDEDAYLEGLALQAEALEAERESASE